jgi:hypothetical protein
MSTPAAVEPPTPENVHLYRAAVLAWRKAAIEERSRLADIRFANPHVPESVRALAPEMTFAQAHLLAQKATNWAAQAHQKWFWRGIPGTAYEVEKASKRACASPLHPHDQKGMIAPWLTNRKT